MHLPESFCCVGSPGVFITPGTYHVYFEFVILRYAPTRRKVADLIEARREKISTLIDSFNVYENLTLKSSKALEFYEKLNTNVSDLKKKVSKAMEENEQEKDAVIAKLAAPKPTAPAQGKFSYIYSALQKNSSFWPFMKQNWVPSN